MWTWLGFERRISQAFKTATKNRIMTFRLALSPSALTHSNWFSSWQPCWTRTRATSFWHRMESWSRRALWSCSWGIILRKDYFCVTQQGTLWPSSGLNISGLPSQLVWEVHSSNSYTRRFWDLTDATLVYKDENSKLVDAVVPLSMFRPIGSIHVWKGKSTFVNTLSVRKWK